MNRKPILALLLLVSSFNAFAQYVIGGVRYTCPVGTSWNDPRCIREQANDEAQSEYRQQIRWATRWGAIATDKAHGSVGHAVDTPSKWEAERGAILDCSAKGANNCKIEFTYSNQCAVMILGDSKYNIQGAENIEIATRLGMDTCNAVDTNCQVYRADCSLPERIR